jgi:hypothetical protein
MCDESLYHTLLPVETLFTATECLILRLYVPLVLQTSTCNESMYTLLPAEAFLAPTYAWVVASAAWCSSSRSSSVMIMPFGLTGKQAH